MAVAGAATAGLVLLSPGALCVAGANRPAGPRTTAQIRGDLREHELRLAYLAILRRLRAQNRASAVRHPSPVQRAAVEALGRKIRQQLSRPRTRGPAEKAGLFSIRNGAGPWPSCEFYGHNFYVTPPMGRSGVQFIIYAGNFPSALCWKDSSTAATSGSGGVMEGVYNASPPPAGVLVVAPFKSPLLVVSAHGDIVRLRTLSGRSITFNFITRKFGT